MSSSVNIAKGRIETLSLLAVALLLMLPCAFGGLDLCDAGFYLTFYQNFFNHPESVSYNFMYYTSGLIGASFYRFTGGSMVAMRLLGIGCNLLALWMVWNAFRRRGRFLPMLMAMLLVACGSWSAPHTFNYDTCNMLLWVATVVNVVRAFSVDPDLTSSKRWLLLGFAGVAAGVNALTRLPNLLDVLMVIPVAICGCRFLPGGSSGAIKRVCKSVGCFLAGWAAGLGALLLLAVTLDHWQYIREAFLNVLDAGNAGIDDSCHSMSKLLESNLTVWTKIAYISIKIAAVALVYNFLHRALVVNGLKSGSLAMCILLALPVAYWLCFTERWLINIDFLSALYIMSFVGITVTAYRCHRSHPDLRVAAVCAVFMLFLQTVGSDGAIYNGGTILLWLPLSLAFFAFTDLVNPILRRAMRAMVVIVSLSLLEPCVENLCDGVMYFDDAPPVRMTSQTGLPYADGIYTSAERAERISKIHSELTEYVKPGDELMVYGFAPLLNYVTDTRPAIGCSWPEQMSSNLLRQKLEASSGPEYVMLLKFDTGPVWGKSSLEFQRGESLLPQKGEKKRMSPYHNPVKSGVMIEYLQKNNYRVIADFEDFTLYTK